jgi:hypothetical protein
MSERNAVFEAADQILYFSSTDLCGSELEGCLIGERGMGSCKPGSHLLQVAFEKLECETDQPCKAHESIGLLGLEPFGVPASGQGPGRDLKELCSSGRRKVENAPESFECCVGEAFPNSGVELSGFVGAETKERNVGVGPLRVGVDLAPEPVDGLGSGSLSDAHDNLLQDTWQNIICHMATHKWGRFITRDCTCQPPSAAAGESQSVIGLY